MSGLPNTSVAVAAASPECRSQAEALSERLSLPLLDDPAQSELVLWQGAERLELRQSGPQVPGPVFVDFVEGALGHRRRFGGGRGQLVAKAVGIKPGRIPTVVDATAGLGRDAFVLAQLGCEVRMVERSPVIAALLADGMQRGMQVPEVAEVLARMALQQADASRYLRELPAEQQPDVVYVDPMHPERTKAAQVKKEMVLFRRLVGGDEDDAELLAAALAAARRRVVVKRPRKAAAIAGPKPSLVMDGKSTRYDIYLINKDSAA